MKNLPLQVRVSETAEGLLLRPGRACPPRAALWASYVLSDRAYFHLRRVRGGLAVSLTAKRGGAAEGREIAEAWKLELETQRLRLALADQDEPLKAQWLREALCP